MTYDPLSQSWRGNESVLSAFESPVKTVRPILISQTTTPTDTGSMVFDPVKCRWTGNEEVLELFDDIPDAPTTNGISKLI